MLSIYRDPSGEWWIDRKTSTIYPTRLRHGPAQVDNIDELENEVANRLRALLFVDVGVTLDDVGKRISDDVFWLYFENE